MSDSLSLVWGHSVHFAKFPMLRFSGGYTAPTIGSILNPLARKFSEDTRKKGKGAKTGASHNWQSFYLSQYD